MAAALHVYKFLDDVGIIATSMIETLAVVKDEARILWRGDLFSTSGTPTVLHSLQFEPVD